MGSNSKPPTVGGDGLYDESYQRFLTAYETHKGDCPKGVRLKLQRERNGRYGLYLRFVQPGSGKRVPKLCGVACTPGGVIQAVEKAHKVKEALDRIPAVSEFWAWYEIEILGKNTQENDLITYREIFGILEDRYFKGRHRNTGKPRSREDLGCLRSWERVYVDVFKCFENWDEYPNWESMKKAIFKPLQNGENLEGSKTFKERVYRCKTIARLAPNSKSLLEKLEALDCRQTQFKERQVINWKEFIKWWVEASEYAETMPNPKHRNARKSWLWVAGACVLYGLRPSEIAAAINLTKPFKTKAGEVIPALNDPDNKQCYLVLGDETYFKVSIKTGGRIIAPIPSSSAIEALKLKTPRLPIYTPRMNSKPKSICEGFDNQFSNRMKNAGCPITELYAFRRLYNLKNESYGVPQELRARMMGHSVTINEGKYKTEGVDATLEVLKGKTRSPLSYNLAVERLSEAGIDPDLPEVSAILKVIYQLD